MRILVIPDVHLKPWMFDAASKLMKEGVAENAVCLMDIPDDWGQQYNIKLYIDTFDRAIQFQKDFPETLWCYGNHDLCYRWDQRESGYSSLAAPIVVEKLNKLQKAIPNEKQLAYIHKIDNVLFLHGGLTESFVQTYVKAKDFNNIGAVVRTINELGCREIWRDGSPVWHRPQYSESKLYKPRKLLQIVGHTPCSLIYRCGNVITCDDFSTDRGGHPIGTRSFIVIDTESWEHEFPGGY